MNLHESARRYTAVAAAFADRFPDGVDTRVGPGVFVDPDTYDDAGRQTTAELVDCGADLSNLVLAARPVLLRLLREASVSPLASFVGALFDVTDDELTALPDPGVLLLYLDPPARAARWPPDPGAAS